MRVAISGAEEPNVPSFHPCPPDPGCPHCGSAAASGSDAPDWSFVDAAYCISLRSRPDRAARAAAELHRVGLCRTVGLPQAGQASRPDPRSASGRPTGRSAWRRWPGVSEGSSCWRTTSASPLVGPRTVRAVGRALAGLPPDWTIFFLGHWPLRAWFVRRNVLRSASGGAHAYVASPRLLEWLRDHPSAPRRSCAWPAPASTPPTPPCRAPTRSSRCWRRRAASRATTWPTAPGESSRSPSTCSRAGATASASWRG